MLAGGIELRDAAMRNDTDECIIVIVSLVPGDQNILLNNGNVVSTRGLQKYRYSAIIEPEPIHILCKTGAFLFVNEL